MGVNDLIYPLEFFMNWYECHVGTCTADAFNVDKLFCNTKNLTISGIVIFELYSDIHSEYDEAKTFTFSLRIRSLSNYNKNSSFCDDYKKKKVQFQCPKVHCSLRRRLNCYHRGLNVGIGIRKERPIPFGWGRSASWWRFKTNAKIYKQLKMNIVSENILMLENGYKNIFKNLY